MLQLRSNNTLNLTKYKITERKNMSTEIFHTSVLGQITVNLLAPVVALFFLCLNKSASPRLFFQKITGNIHNCHALVSNPQNP